MKKLAARVVNANSSASRTGSQTKSFVLRRVRGPMDYQMRLKRLLISKSFLFVAQAIRYAGILATANSSSSGPAHFWRRDLEVMCVRPGRPLATTTMLSCALHTIVYRAYAALVVRTALQTLLQTLRFRAPTIRCILPKQAPNSHRPWRVSEQTADPVCLI
jgi:hypothetical protein